nr:hypothetical protein GCM10020241_60230 [Streptoalloteichus tenebrarius]
MRRRRDHVATRVTAVPAMPERASRLRMRWGSLRVADLDRDREWVAPELRECERSVSRALARLASFEGRLDRLLDRRRELRGLLAAYQARAADHGLAEDDELDDAYRAAHATLWTAPCDLIAAADRVARYQRAVRRRIEGGSGGGWR